MRDKNKLISLKFNFKLKRISKRKPSRENHNYSTYIGQKHKIKKGMCTIFSVENTEMNNQCNK